MQSLPTFSVIIPLEDHRGLAGPNIRSWGAEQTYNRRDIELVLVADCKESEHDDAVESLLLSHDSIIYSESDHLFKMYDVGARAAHGDILVFTEHHVLADSGCIAALADFFTKQPYQAAACRDVSISENFIARMQERLMQEIFAGSWTQDPWKAVLARGFAIKKALYLAEGGFKYQYEGFAEFALAIDLHKHQHALGFAHDAVVHHYNTHVLVDIRPPQAAFARGELAYRADRSAEDCVPYLGHIPAWAERASYRVENSRLLASTIARNLFGKGRQSKTRTLLAQSGAFLRFGWYALWGARWLQFKWNTTLPFAWLKVRLSRWDDDKCFNAYVAYWRHIVQCGYYEFIAAYLPKTEPHWQEAQRYQLYDSDEEQLVGFNLPEYWQGCSFRWSSAASMFGVPHCPADYEVTVQLLTFEHSLDPDVYLYFNDYELSELVFDAETSRLSFRIDAAMFKPGTARQFLIILSDTRQTRPVERRQLGLPIQSIEFHCI